MRKIILFCFLLTALVSNAQIFTPASPTIYGSNNNRVNAIFTLHIPMRCGAPTSSADLHSTMVNNAALLYDSCGSTLYSWDPHNHIWIAVGSGGGIPGILDSIQARVKYTDTSAMLAPYRKSYYTTRYGLDSSSFIISSIDGLQNDTIKFTAGSGGGGGGGGITAADTAAMLSHYYNKTSADALLALKQGNLTLTTIGTGASTLIGNTLNIPTPSSGSSPLLDVTIGGTPVEALTLPGVSYANLYKGSSTPIQILQATSDIRYQEQDTSGFHIDSLVFNNLEQTNFGIRIQYNSYLNKGYVRFKRLKYLDQFTDGDVSSSFTVKNVYFDSLIRNTQRLNLYISDSVLTMPILEFGGFSISDADAHLTSILLPKYKSSTLNGATGVYVSGGSTSLKRFIAPFFSSNNPPYNGSLSLNDCTALSLVQLSNHISFPQISIQNGALSQASVDAILFAAIAGSATFGTIDLSGGTSSAPSAGGLTAKATLITNGVTVITN